MVRSEQKSAFGANYLDAGTRILAGHLQVKEGRIECAAIAVPGRNLTLVPLKHWGRSTIPRRWRVDRNRANS